MSGEQYGLAAPSLEDLAALRLADLGGETVQYPLNGMRTCCHLDGHPGLRSIWGG